MSDPSFDEFYFCYTLNLERIVNKSGCYKNRGNSSCIDLILTNKQEGFLKAKNI